MKNFPPTSRHHSSEMVSIYSTSSLQKHLIKDRSGIKSSIAVPWNHVWLVWVNLPDLPSIGLERNLTHRWRNSHETNLSLNGYILFLQMLFGNGNSCPYVLLFLSRIGFKNLTMGSKLVKPAFINRSSHFLHQKPYDFFNRMESSEKFYVVASALNRISGFYKARHYFENFVVPESSAFEYLRLSLELSSLEKKSMKTTYLRCSSSVQLPVLPCCLPFDSSFSSTLMPCSCCACMRWYPNN